MGWKLTTGEFDEGVHSLTIDATNLHNRTMPDVGRGSTGNELHSWLYQWIWPSPSFHA